MEHHAYVASDLGHVAVRPNFQRLNELATSEAAVGLHFQRLAVNHIDFSAIGSYRSVLLFRSLQSVVVLRADFIDADALRFRAPLPEIIDVQIALRVAFELQKRVELLGLDDGVDVRQKLSIFIR